MNAIFDINRFINLEKRNIVSDRMQYLYIASALVGLYIISTLLFIVAEVSLAKLMVVFCMGLIICAPCLLEKNVSKNKSIFDFMLPASTFEKFASFFVKYLIVVPFLCFTVVALLCVLSNILPFEVLNSHAQYLHVEAWLSFNAIQQLIIAQSLFFLGHFYFRRHAFPKVFLSIILFSLFLSIISGIMFALYSPEYGELRYTFNFGQSNVSDSNNILFESLKALFPIGMWITAFFKLRETEI